MVINIIVLLLRDGRGVKLDLRGDFSCAHWGRKRFGSGTSTIDCKSSIAAFLPRPTRSRCVICAIIIFPSLLCPANYSQQLLLQKPVGMSRCKERREVAAELGEMRQVGGVLHKEHFSRIISSEDRPDQNKQHATSGAGAGKTRSSFQQKLRARLVREIGKSSSNVCCYFSSSDHHTTPRGWTVLRKDDRSQCSIGALELRY